MSRLETLQTHLVEHRQFMDVATGSLHEKAGTHESSIVELRTPVNNMVAHLQQVSLYLTPSSVSSANEPLGS
jgi:hypothetical protein